MGDFKEVDDLPMSSEKHTLTFKKAFMPENDDCSVFRVDCYTPKTVFSDFPENSYNVNTPEEVADIVKNCARKIAGIRCVEVWIEKPGALENLVDKSE